MRTRAAESPSKSSRPAVALAPVDNVVAHQAPVQKVALAQSVVLAQKVAAPAQSVVLAQKVALAQSAARARKAAIAQPHQASRSSLRK